MEFQSWMTKQNQEMQRRVAEAIKSQEVDDMPTTLTKPFAYPQKGIARRTTFVRCAFVLPINWKLN